MRSAILLALLSASALGATVQDVRETFLADCVRRGTERNAPNAKAFCTCSFNVIEDNMTLSEYRELERLTSERRPAQNTPQFKRVFDQLEACKKERNLR